VSFVETQGLTKVYSTGKVKVAALSDVDVAVEQGAFVGVTGASGSGKSTLMNLIGGLDTPSSGSIRVGGKDIAKLTRGELALYRRHEVGMIFQSFNVISAYTAVENVGFPLLFAGVAKKERLARAERMLEKVGLSERKDHRPTELSGGEQQRVAIARALINEPNVLLADEPTGNLDSRTSREVVQVLGELNEGQGLTVIMISHEEDLLAEFSGEVIRLRDGRIEESGKEGQD